MMRSMARAWLMLAAVHTSLACRGTDSAADSDSGHEKCGALAVWILPEGVQVSSTDLDSAWVAEQGDITRARLNLVAQAAEAFCRAEGRYPTTLNELLTAASDETLPPACRSVLEFTDDAWGGALDYSVENSIPSIVSGGSDRRMGTDDDLRAARTGDEATRALRGEVDCRS